MKKFIGVKEINAKSMTRQEYNDFRGWELPEDENGDDDGFLIEYINGGEANNEEFKGYVSWSPHCVFHNAYREVSGMSFGLAIEAMKKGAKVARAGWNGKDMWISLTDGLEKVDSDIFWNANNQKFADSNGGCADVLPVITMKTADNKILMGWLASQTDMIADDWEII